MRTDDLYSFAFLNVQFTFQASQTVEIHLCPNISYGNLDLLVIES